MILRIAVGLVYNTAVFPLVWGIAHTRRRRLLERPRTLRLELTGLPHLAPQHAMWRDDSGPAWPDLSQMLDAIKTHPTVKGVFVVLDGASGSLADMEDLRSALAELRTHGKSIQVHLDGIDGRTALVAMHADHVTLTPGGSVMLRGAAIESRFFGESLAKLGIQVESARAGDYKGIVEPFSRSEPSAAFSEAAGSLVSALDHSWRAAMTSGAREHARAALELRLADQLILTRSDAQHIGIIDSIGYAEEAEQKLARTEAATQPLRNLVRRARGQVDEPELLAAGEASLIMPRPRPLRRGGYVAVIALSGALVDEPAGPLSRPVVVARQWAHTIDGVRRERSLEAAVVVIDSRGGSTVASDRLWHAVKRLAESKPTVVWMRDYAASGGYYIACAANHVIASPFTLTGSIGVAWLKPSAEALARRLGVRTYEYGATAGRSLTSALHGLTAKDRAAMEASIEEAYRRFVTVVGEGRKMGEERVHELAQGRVWTGAQAHQHGLVDVLGGFAEVDGWLKATLDKSPTRPIRYAWVGQRPLWQRALQWVGRFSESSNATATLARTAWSEIDEWALLQSGGPLQYWCPPLHTTEHGILGRG